MFIFTSLTLPPAARTAFSSAGVSCLHGPHHGAQKVNQHRLLSRFADHIGGKACRGGVLDDIACVRANGKPSFACAVLGGLLGSRLTAILHRRGITATGATIRIAVVAHLGL